MIYSSNFVEKNFNLWKNKYCKSHKWKVLVQKYYEKKFELSRTVVEEISTINLDFLKIPEVEIKEELRINETTKTRILDMKDEVFDEANYIEHINPHYKKLTKGWQINGQVVEFYIRHLRGNDQDNARNTLKRLYENMDTFFRIPHSKQFMDSLNILNGNSIFLLVRFFQTLNSYLRIDTIDINKVEKDINNLGLNFRWQRNKTGPYYLKMKDKNFTKELIGWVLFGKKTIDNKYITTYNDKLSPLSILMQADSFPVELNEFYSLFNKYFDERKPYPDFEKDVIKQLLFADQFYQFLYELEPDLKNRNIIYYGSPGTGKTFGLVEDIIKAQELDAKYYRFIQFHPSYTYEDFIEGIRPSLIKDGKNIEFELIAGEFKKLCIDASKEPTKDFYFFVDEINRGELSRIFGELLYAIEYRLEFEKNEDGSFLIDQDGKYSFKSTHIPMRTQYSHIIDLMNDKDKQKHSVLIKDGKSYFGVPENVYFIGTMNDIDKSIDNFDLALRRRFVWIRKEIDYNVVNEILSENEYNIDFNIDDYIESCKKLNKNIIDNSGKGLSLSESYQLGHYYFLKILDFYNSVNDFNFETAKQGLFNSTMKPLLFEYLRSEISESEAINKLKVLQDEFVKGNG